ncbi:MAG: hypothetical protein AAF512_05430 [Pseudomonadota bacterium]
MDWQAISAIGDILGAFGVIVTLIYLAGQLRQNTKELRSARHESYAALSFSVNEFRAEHAETIAKHFAGEELSDAELIVANANAQKLFGIMETAYLHYREGTLAKDVFDARMIGLTAIMSYAPVRDIWEQSKNYGFTDDFIQLVEARIPASDD